MQLLAERAQYITGASGAAIALRRGEHNDMLCRASTGSNAPELGALLSMGHGLSGESIRTRQAMRCDDTERDLRVNQEGCRRWGIASVVVMPIVSDEQALGVFELFSGKPNAFNERDLSALRRLSEMVATSVKLAVAAQTATADQQPANAEPQTSAAVAVEPIPTEQVAIESVANPVFPASAPSASDLPPQKVETTSSQKTAATGRALGKPTSEKTPVEAPKKPLFWSAVMQTNGSSAPADAAAESIVVPPMLRNLQKCQACGFPVSQGRTLCVECEEKQWRSARLSAPAAKVAPQAPLGPKVVPPSGPARKTSVSSNSPSAQASSHTAASTVPAIPKAAVTLTPQTSISAAIKPAATAGNTSVNSTRKIPADLPQNVSRSASPYAPASDNLTPFLSSAVQSESWFAANKYILGALLVVAIVIAAVAWLR